MGKMATTQSVCWWRGLVQMVMVVMVVVMVKDTAAQSVCPPASEDETTTVEEGVHYADVVVLGEVLQQFPDPQSPSLYTATLHVHCVYKGSNIASTINITHAGDSSDPCSERHFEVGDQYLAYLYNHGDNVFTPAYPQHPGGYSDEVYILCNITVGYPTGMDKESAEVKCEDSAQHDEPCLPKFKPKPGSTSKFVKPKEMPYKTPKVEKIAENRASADNGGQLLCVSPVLLGLYVTAAVWIGL